MAWMLASVTRRSASPCPALAASSGARARARATSSAAVGTAPGAASAAVVSTAVMVLLSASLRVIAARAGRSAGAGGDQLGHRPPGPAGEPRVRAERTVAVDQRRDGMRLRVPDQGDEQAVVTAVNGLPQLAGGPAGRAVEPGQPLGQGPAHPGQA